MRAQPLSSPNDAQGHFKVILYAYMNHIYSCRKIEILLHRDIHYIWLVGYEKPDFITINRFRNRVKHEINEVFTQVLLLLSSKGFISLNVEYIDGTKIESKANKYTFVWKSKANKYTFVWRKTVERNRERLMKKIYVLLGQIDDAIAQEKSSESHEEIAFTPAMLTEMAGELRSALEQVPEPSTREGKAALKKTRKQLKELEGHRDKLQEYDNHLKTLQGRNSYSKTDKDATFMRMKEDAMRNGQTKPGYNLQIGTENQFITDFALFPNPTDTLTMKPFLQFLQSFPNRYGSPSHTVVADSGYGSEENYRFMEENGMEAYVKYNRFHMEQRPRFNPDPFKAENFYYNEGHDFCVCPMGQKMRRIGTKRVKTASGYVSENARYRAVRCDGCPLRCRSQRAALLRGRSETPGTAMHRTGSRVRTNEKQYELQAFPPFWEGQGLHGLFQMLGTHKSEKSPKYRSLKNMNRFLWLTKKEGASCIMTHPPFFIILVPIKR